jgi:hypothetical protein
MRKLRAGRERKILEREGKRHQTIELRQRILFSWMS